MLRAFLPIAALRALLQLPPRGVAIVEFALGLPFLIWLLVGLGDLGLGFYQSLQVQGAAAAGAAYATLHRWDVCNVQAAVRSATNISEITAPTPTRVCGCPGDSPFVVGTYSNETCGGTPVVSDCTGTCSSGSSPGVYASVRAQLTYTPVAPWPATWGLVPESLTGQAYRRLQ